MKYFTSDIHLFHNLVLKKYRNEFSSFEEMHHDFVTKWNKQVNSKDIVFVLGDVSFGKFEETKSIISKLNGRKILIRGNHDERFNAKQWIQIGFDDIRDTFVFKKNTENFKPAEKIILCHYPYSSQIRYFFYKIFGKLLGRRSEAAYYKLYLAYKGHKLLHGHHHEGPVYKFDQVNVAWDIHRRLLNENEVMDLFKNNKPTGFVGFLKKIKTIFW